MDKNIPKIYDLLQNLSWYFGNQGFDGECCEDLSLVEYLALKKAYDKKNITIQELGLSLNITKSGSSKIVDRLEKKMYIARNQSSSDGRFCCVTLTAKGINAIHNISNRYSEYLNEILGEVSEESMKTIKDSLELLFTRIKNKGYIKSI